MQRLPIHSFQSRGFSPLPAPLAGRKDAAVNVNMASGSNTRTFPTVLSSKDYLDHLSNEEQRRYMEKLQVLGTCDPYLAPAAVFEPLNTSRSLP